MAEKNRDDFTEKTKLQIAKRAGWLCSAPSCRKPTVGSNADGDGVINIGTAAHICAAAPGGPRYDPSMTSEQRRSPDNGIWLCRNHGTAVDADDPEFTVELLRAWKAQAQADSRESVLTGVAHGLATQPRSEDEMFARLKDAAAEDLEVFRRSWRWPSTAIELSLQVDGLADAVGASALATALTTLDDLLLVAPPGVGKTTTVLQVAEAALANSDASPIVVPLGDWSTDSASLLGSVLKRPAFQRISEDEFRAVAAKPGVALLLDGWNELDSGACRRATVQVKGLQSELPQLSFMFATRKQALDVPVEGITVNLVPLSETQQLDIARALHGEAGERLVDLCARRAALADPFLHLRESSNPSCRMRACATANTSRAISKSGARARSLRESIRC
jgi:hypothetical protein